MKIKQAIVTKKNTIEMTLVPGVLPEANLLVYLWKPLCRWYICNDWKNRFEVATKNGWKLAKR